MQLSIKLLSLAAMFMAVLPAMAAPVAEPIAEPRAETDNFDKLCSSGKTWFLPFEN